MAFLAPAGAKDARVNQSDFHQGVTGSFRSSLVALLYLFFCYEMRRDCQERNGNRWQRRGTHGERSLLRMLEFEQGIKQY
jgi:hypothetical protein